MAVLSVHDRLALSRDAKKLSLKAVARKYCCGINTARRWAAVDSENPTDFEDQPRAGRPRSLARCEVVKAKRMADAKRSVPDIAARINRDRGSPVSPATVNRALKSGRVPRYWRPALHVTELRQKNKPVRVAFARKHVGSSKKDWVFIDGCSVYIVSKVTDSKDHP